MPDYVSLELATLYSNGGIALEEADRRMDSFQSNCSGDIPGGEITRAESYLEGAVDMLVEAERRGHDIGLRLNRLIELNRAYGASLN